MSSSTRSPSTRTLSFDLIHSIGSFLLDHPQTTQAAALTCRLWHDALRPHIFRIVTIRSLDDTERLSALLSSDIDVVPWIRGVRIFASSHGDWFHRFPIIFPPGALVNLQSFYFHIQLAEEYKASRYQVFIDTLPTFSSFANIRRLEFRDCLLPYDALKAIIGAFPSLVDVCVRDTHYFDQSDVQFPFLHQPINLSSLRIYRQCDLLPRYFPHSSVRAPQLVQPFANLETLHFHFGEESEAIMKGLAPVIFPLMNSSLRHLKLYLPGDLRSSKYRAFSRGKSA